MIILFDLNLSDLFPIINSMQPKDNWASNFATGIQVSVKLYVSQSFFVMSLLSLDNFSNFKFYTFYIGSNKLQTVKHKPDPNFY